MNAKPTFEERTVDELTIEDERSFRHVALYADLKEVLVRANYRFRVLPPGGTWDRALFLNLTYWSADRGGDVLVDPSLPADVVAHAAWHHLASVALAGAPGEAPSPDALFLGEAIASAFDVYLVGRLLGRAPDSEFLATQVEAMSESTAAAGLDEAGFEALLAGIAEDPDAAFADLRELLSDATAALFACKEADDALAALAPLDGHRFAPLLHRFELSNWILYARAHAGRSPASRDDRAAAVDRVLRAEPHPLEWLTSTWVLPATRATRAPRP